MPHVLLVGISTRAAAESAARAGFGVTAIDAFADRDQHAAVRALACERDFSEPFSARALARAARTCASDAAVYLSPVENDLRAVSMLARGRQLWGNSSAVLARVRNPLVLRAAMADAGIAVPRIALQAADVTGGPGSQWLVKPFRSGGGSGVHIWNGSRRLPRGTYLQEVVEGTVGSVVFAAAGGSATILGLSRQIVGDAAFGASGFRYCGTILAAEGDAQFSGDGLLVEAASRAASDAASAFDLVGVNGLDFVARDGIPHVIEINPRWSSSMEVVERAYGVGVFAFHAAACTGAGCPSFDFSRKRRTPGAVGRAIVYAREDAVAGDTDAWLEDGAGVRDVPRPGERIMAGRPICSVFADAADGAGCYAALVARATRIYAEVAGWRTSEH